MQVTLTRLSITLLLAPVHVHSRAVHRTGRYDIIMVSTEGGVRTSWSVCCMDNAAYNA